MKRFWLLVLLLAGSLVSLQTPAFAKDDADMSDSMDDVNSALGSLAVKVNDMEKSMGLKFYGDLRLRYAYEAQDQSNPAQLNNGKATIYDRARGRYRARFGLKKSLGEFSANIRLATGTTSNPNSENNTFDTAFDNPAIDIDTAAITYKPEFLNGQVELTGGKFGNPLAKTQINWDADIQPEGAVVQFKTGDTKVLGTYFEIINEGGKLPSEFCMQNLQLSQGIQMDSDASVDLMVGYEYIPWTNLLVNGAVLTAGTNVNQLPLTAGNVNDPNFGGVKDFQVGEAMVTVKHKVGDVPFKWTLHLTDNFNSNNLPNSTTVANGYSSFTNQYAEWLSLDLGAVHGKGDWSGTLAVAQVDPNAQLANLVDDDAGGTNRQYAMGVLNYGIDNGVVLTLKEYAIYHEYYNVVSASTSLGGSSQALYSTTMVDLMASF